MLHIYMLRCSSFMQVKLQLVPHGKIALTDKRKQFVQLQCQKQPQG